MAPGPGRWAIARLAPGTGGSVAAVSHTLTTQRLILRPVTASDHADLLGHWTAPDVRRFLFDGGIQSPAEISGVIDDSTRSIQLPRSPGRGALPRYCGPCGLLGESACSCKGPQR